MKSKWWVIRNESSGRYLVIIRAGIGKFHATQIADKERATMSQNFHSLKPYIGPLEKAHGEKFSVVLLNPPKRKNPAPNYQSRAAKLVRLGKIVDAKMEIERDKLMARKGPGVKKRITGKTYYSPIGKAFREQIQKGIRLSDMLSREASKENRRKNPSSTYEVNVGNIGTVLTTKSKTEALKTYQEYVSQSVKSYGRASGEDVVLIHNGEPVKEHYGTQED